EVVDDHLFAMVHGRLVLGDLDAGLEHLAPAGAGGGADDFHVDVGPGDDYLHAHAALARVEQRLHGQVVGDEVGGGEADVLLGGGDGEQVEQFHRFAAVVGGTLEDLGRLFARLFQRGKIIIARQHFAGG